MVPNENQIKILWDRYNLPDYKRTHVELVAKVAVFLARTLIEKSAGEIDISLLESAALLHDIDKNIPRLPGEQHPDTGVRILKAEGMEEIADVVKTHSLHHILNPQTAPITWEQKILFLADKMVQQDIITVDKRFALWRAENLSEDARRVLEESYPKVKELEQEIFSLIQLQPGRISELLNQSI